MTNIQTISNRDHYSNWQYHSAVFVVEHIPNWSTLIDWYMDQQGLCHLEMRYNIHQQGTIGQFHSDDADLYTEFCLRWL